MTNGCTADPTNQCDFDVKLVFPDGAVESTSYSYSRPDFAPRDIWASANGKTFDYLQTALFKVGTGTPVGLSVNDLAGAANCMMVLNGREHAYLTLGGDISSNQYPIPPAFSNQEPIQLTLIPFNSGAAACNTGEGIREPGRALAVFIAKPTSSLTPDCDIQTNVGEMDGYASGSCEITGSKQSWVHSTDPNTGTQTVEFRGSLVNMLNSQRANNQLSIRIGESVSLDRGLSTQTAWFEVMGSNCAAIVSNINANGFDAVTDKKTDCSVVGDVHVREAQNAADRLIVEGFGRINGYTVLERYQRCRPNDPNSSCGASFPDGNFTPWEEARWDIDVQLLNLTSEYQSHSKTFGIDVSHITVAWPAYRGASPIELNIFRDEVQNNHAVKMFNVKQVGGWIDQADGPEVMGSGSQIFYTYIHAADDAIKISAPSVSYNNTTILKGAAGGAVNIGSYGYNRTVSGSRVNDVFIHRITQKSTSGTPSGFDFNDTLGVIFAPTCPIAPQGASAGTPANTSGTNINGVYIPNLGTDEGPNSIGRLFSLGVQDTEFCKQNLEVDITFGNFDFSDFEIYINPQDVSYIFGQTKAASITWEPIKFGNPAACDASSVRIFPDSQIKDWYCVCGPVPTGKRADERRR